MSATSALVSPALALDTMPRGLPRLTVGDAALAWAMRWLVQPNGPRAGLPWRPTDRQAAWTLWWYAVNEDGRWLFNHGARRLAKGSGKSPFAAVLSLIEFAGPCRVADIDGGRVLAKPVDMPLVQIAATAESQTKNTMRMVRAMAPKGSRVVEEHSLDPGISLYYKLDTGGELHVITSSATAAEGAEVTSAIGDETEHWNGSNGGTLLADVLDRNLAKSGSRMMETANAWEPGAGSVAESTWDAYVAQQEGRTKGDAQILYDAVIAPHDTELGDEDSLMRALDHVYADCPWVDRQTIRDRIWDPRTKPDVARRYYLNQPTASINAWLSAQEWAALADSTVTMADRDEVALFFDGSKSNDATALIGCRISDGHVFTLGVWEPTDGETVPMIDVDRTVSEAFERFHVLGFFADVREWEDHVKSTWPDLYADQLLVHAESKNTKDPQPIAWDMRGKVWDFTKAVELCEAEALAGQFTHDGDSRVARHVVNARRRGNRYGYSIAKESPKSPKKIDAAVCVVGARMVRRLVLAEIARSGRNRESYVYF
jgi:hypothetical protein